MLDVNGIICLSTGYAWDGASGPCPDTVSVMKASLLHDALCQLVRHNLLPRSEKDHIDDVFYNQCIKDGVPKWIAMIYRWGLKHFAHGEIKLEPIPPVIEIP